MYKILKIALLYLLILNRLIAAPWLFVSPLTENTTGPMDLSNFKFERDNKDKVLLFESDRSDHSEIENLLNRSEMIEFVHQLRIKARQKHIEQYGKYASPDTDQTPYAVVMSELFGKGGPAVASLRIKVEDQQLRTNSLLILAPIGLKDDQIDIADFVSENYLAPLIAHEFFHGIMGDIYGERMLEMKARSFSNKGHRADLITDQYLAFIEGTAEAMELATLELYPKEVNHELVGGRNWSQTKLNLFRQVKYKRLVAAKHNHLGLIHDGHQKDGELDSANDLLKIEGVISTLLYQLLFKSNLENPFDKLLDVMVKHKPMTFIDFLQAFVDTYPEHKPQIIQQFLESTRYVTVSYDAAELYKQQYLLSKQMKQGQVRADEYESIKNQWAVFRAGLLAEVLEGSKRLDHTIRPIFGIKDEMGFFDFDLNQATADDLFSLFSTYFRELSTSEERTLFVGRILRMLENKSFVKNVEDLPFPEGIKVKFDELNHEYNSYYETMVELRLEKLREYSSWIEGSNVDEYLKFYKLHQ